MQVNPNTLVGAADGDSGASTITPVPATNVSSGPSSPDVKPTDTSGTGREPLPGTQNSDSSTSSWFVPIETWKPGNGESGGKPGKRLKNPLGSLASYTYQLSLYMITPDAYEMFVAGGRKNIHQFERSVSTSALSKQAPANTSSVTGGAYLVAQSGGIGPDEQRIPGLEYDLYFDKLSFKHLTNPKSTGTSVNNIEFNFSLIEPYGFSFVTKLRNANDEIMKYANGVSVSKEATKQFFILGIRFYGWDQSGQLVSGNQQFGGQPIDPSASGSTALFETFYDLIITEFKFKLDGRSTIYNIKAASTQPGLGANVKRGFLTTTKSVSGRTVHEALAGPEGLLTKLNKDQQNLKNIVPITYKIEWVGDAKTIAEAQLISDNELSKARQAGSSASTTTNANVATEQKSQPQPDKYEIQLGENKSIIESIDLIISRSQWLEDQLSTGYVDTPENDPKQNAPVETKNDTPEKFKWFNISPKITNITWDTGLKDWAYDITYVIQTYLMPTVDNPYIKDTTSYYGPHKRYDYWYTGQNTEILGYSQELDHSYFVSVLGSPPDSTTPSSTNTGGNAANSDSAGAPIGPNSMPEQMPGGGGNKSQAVKSSVRTSLYDPGAWATATVDILGDPDYLMQDTATSINDVYNRHYGTKEFDINPTGGQVFFEIDFKEAVDYSSSGITAQGINSQGGTLSINESISFGTDADNVVDPSTGKKIVNGVRYMLLDVTNTFSNGSFKQKLKAVMTPLDKSYNALTESARKEAETDASSTTPTPTANGNTTTTSLPKDAPVAPGTAGSGQPAVANKPQQGADDDNSGG